MQPAADEMAEALAAVAMPAPVLPGRQCHAPADQDPGRSAATGRAGHRPGALARERRVAWREGGVTRFDEPARARC